MTDREPAGRSLRGPGLLAPGVAGPGMAMAAMLSVQLGAALSTGLFAQLGTPGTAWLRLSWAAVFFLIVARPPLRRLPRRVIAAASGLGVVTGSMTMLFLAAIDRIPLGTAVAIEFLGPLSVAVLRSHSRRQLVWPLLAGVGVLALTEPWQAAPDAAGLLFAAGAAVGWGGYIVLTQHVGDEVGGVRGLGISIPVAALVAGLVGAPEAVPELSWDAVLFAAFLAVLLPVVPFSLEMLALRRLTAAAFGTLMSLEPAMALLIGLLVLDQRPSGGQLIGIALVVAAGVGAQRHGRRDPDGALGPIGDVVAADGSG
jgi:inner membrane transporter RhtA